MKNSHSKKELAENSDTVIELTQIGALSLNRLNQKESPPPSIETTQIGPSQDFWGGGGCFFQPFKYCLQPAISLFIGKKEVNGIVVNNVCRNHENMKSSSSKKGLAEKPDTVIETTQIGASQDCCGFGCCFQYCLQPAINLLIGTNENGINVCRKDGTIKVRIGGLGTRVFGDNTKNVFLDPDKIDPEKIAYFINQLIKAYDKNTSHKLSVFNTSDDWIALFDKLCSDKENMKFVAHSASAGSLLVLISFLKNQNDKSKESFYKEVVAKLFPLADGEQRLELQKKAQELMEYIAKEVNFVNPPGILFHAGLAHYYYLNPKLQSLAVGEQRLAGEGYFINMLREYLSGGFKLFPTKKSLHGGIPSFCDDKNFLISSVTDDIVFPFYYVAMFAKDLQTYNLDDETISKFVYKVMQYGKIVKKEDGTFEQISKFVCKATGCGDIGKKEDGTFELDDFCQVAINELKLSNDHKDEVSAIAKEYLNIRDGYLALQRTYLRDLQNLQKESPINPYKTNDKVKENNEKVKENFFNSAKASHETFLKNPPLRGYEFDVTSHLDKFANELKKYFANELEKYNLNDGQIDNFVYKVMQHGEKKDVDTLELNNLFRRFIKELKLSDDQRNKSIDEVARIVAHHLDIRKYYLAYFDSIEAFPNELKKYNLGDEKIFEFVKKVMDHGKIVEKEVGKFELDDVCKQAINELNLSNDQHKDVSDMVKEYLKIRDDYLALQIRENFLNSAKDFHETFLQNQKQKDRTPHGIARVFDLWKEIFRRELKEYNLGDEKIFEFVSEVMQYGDIVKKKDCISELDDFCQLAIKKLKLSDDNQRKEVSAMVEKYLNIRDGYSALQKTYWRGLQKECPTNPESVIKNNKQVEENFFNSVEALHKTLLQNFKQEYSSTPDGISRVFYVCAAIFRNELKEYNLNHEQIFKFVDKVMLCDKSVEKDGGTDELDDGCKQAINELNLSDEHKDRVSDMAKKYLKIRDGCRDWRKTERWETEDSENLCLIKENFFNSVEAFHETLLQNFKQEYPPPRGYKSNVTSQALHETFGVETPSTAVSSANGQDVSRFFRTENSQKDNRLVMGLLKHIVFKL